MKAKGISLPSVKTYGIGHPPFLAERSDPMSEVRGGGREEQPHVRRVAAAQVQEGREELLHHVQGQEGKVRHSSCTLLEQP